MRRVVLCAVIVLCYVGQVEAGIQYTITDLGRSGGVGGSNNGGINDSGQATAFDDNSSPIIYDFAGDSEVTYVGTLGGTYSCSRAINNSGQVVGYSNTGSSWRAFLFDDTSDPKMIDLGTLGGRDSDAHAINDVGQVVGYANTAAGKNHAFFSNGPGSPMVELGTLGGDSSYARGINNLGQVVGHSSTGTAEHAFFSDGPGSPMIDLGTLGGELSHALGINESGQVVGFSATSRTGTASHAFVSDGTPNSMIDLGTLGGKFSEAWAINNSGQIVGFSYTSSNATHAFISDGPGTPMIDLNTLVDPSLGWTLNYARGINESGWIVGTGSRNGQSRFFVLTPIASSRDFNDDGNVDLADVNLLTAVGDLTAGVPVPQADARFDLTGDDIIDSADLDQWLIDAAAINGYSSPYLKGDANLNGQVNVWRLDGSGDAQILSEHLGTASGAVWGDGDFNGDGDVDVWEFAGLGDAQLLATNLLKTNDVAAMAVPEPSSLTLISLGALSLIGIGWQRRGAKDRRS